MFYHLLYPFHQEISWLNLFRYITFRSAGAAITALLISFLIGPFIIRKLQQLQIKEEIRSDGPQTHLTKRGTPTMGGLIILCAVIIPTFLWARLDNLYVGIILLATVWMGFVGFYDDYLKAVKKKKKGLVAKYKLAGQISLGILIGVILLSAPRALGLNFSHHVTETTIPFFKDLLLNFGVLYIPMIVIVVTATSNGVNLTDGLDGLAIGIVGIAAAAFGMICYVSGHVQFSDYLNIIYLDTCGELTVFCAALMGASLGFLWFNSHPAEIFMGDTGSLALGGALGTLAVLVKKEFLLVIIGGIFVIEAASVILQTTYFKYSRARTGTGRRIFRMAPIHHHFEQLGWPENKVVVRFWIIQILLVLISLTTFKIR
ncbi:phospho-N-acetylmuramoyl-pentapeptide-transferase [candidate division LCP-89 bacterium B3_LCP]|uniref:Phospho-N-acetylmuramoyl-pentapeptide-transferase n=1 Tax=candidate division LCP-89 bacterium B3_LCP TaxID=2012998 RepID=A0A532V2Q1_UNCL8|nr:MAG: phospho-N-acetylmuramoyl-pentapeptide-transferase [candidate division LCP-89 bacterium B3_LCP]